MDRNDLFGFTLEKLQAGSAVKMAVQGISMKPVIDEGDIVTVRKREYKIGDIVVFIYPGEGLLVHRLLKIINEDFYCKGDNCFRQEQIPRDHVIGAVDEINGEKVPECTDEFLCASKRINEIFVEFDFDVCRVKETAMYKEYFEKYIEI